jgi:hypothetical protein
MQFRSSTVLLAGWQEGPSKASRTVELLLEALLPNSKPPISAGADAQLWLSCHTLYVMLPTSNPTPLQTIAGPMLSRLKRELDHPALQPVHKHLVDKPVALVENNVLLYQAHATHHLHLPTTVFQQS